MFDFARSHPALVAWLAAALIGLVILSTAGPAVFIITAAVILPVAADPAPVAFALVLLVLAFYASCLVAIVLTVRRALRQ